jgi:hypothetical protein
MIEYACSKDRFLEDVKDHSIKIRKEDGVYRHLEFSRAESSTYRFDIHTWPGFLCICGDMGTFVFSRLTDMFEFFRQGKDINPRYWAEKLQAVNSHCGGAGSCQEFDETRFKEVINEYLDEIWEYDTPEIKKEVRYDVELNILSLADAGETIVLAAANMYDGEYCHQFTDLLDYSLRKYTFHFIWILRAIVWGIQKYDEAKKEIEA